VQSLSRASEVQFVADSNKTAQLADFKHDSIIESIESVIGLIMHQCRRKIDGSEMLMTAIGGGYRAIDVTMCEPGNPAFQDPSPFVRAESVLSFKARKPCKPLQ